MRGGRPLGPTIVAVIQIIKVSGKFSVVKARN